MIWVRIQSVVAAKVTITDIETLNNASTAVLYCTNRNLKY